MSKHVKTLSSQTNLLQNVFGSSIFDNLAQLHQVEKDKSVASNAYNPYLQVSFECAQFTLPLCHAGVCDSNKTIEVFVKRALANKQNPKAVWLLQGGPGASTAGTMEKIMVSVYKRLDGAANVYTMDHRGTGRSHRLGCTAAQVETSGSPTYGEITPEVLSACIQDVNIQLGASINCKWFILQHENNNSFIASILSAFSTTSAALDLSTLINYTNNTNTYVYGVSYGTYLVERLMQLNNSNIRGYILDGVVSQSGRNNFV
ncbi:serine protease family S33 [Thraustotheca clavata]|uniref:Serine protease family S33 n=1 Tax=Thraustotheca clavata TaxID=74557 RepID=A0A1V9YCE6_9STRA|nr:serine protease family S33 [Thraustotheca clavata]